MRAMVAIGREQVGPDQPHDGPAESAQPVLSPLLGEDRFAGVPGGIGRQVLLLAVELAQDSTLRPSEVRTRQEAVRAGRPSTAAPRTGQAATHEQVTRQRLAGGLRAGVELGNGVPQAPGPGVEPPLPAQPPRAPVARRRPCARRITDDDRLLHRVPQHRSSHAGRRRSDPDSVDGHARRRVERSGVAVDSMLPPSVPKVEIGGVHPLEVRFPHVDAECERATRVRPHLARRCPQSPLAA